MVVGTLVMLVGGVSVMAVRGRCCWLVFFCDYGGGVVVDKRRRM
jgi:hypothetical protein